MTLYDRCLDKVHCFCITFKQMNLFLKRLRHQKRQGPARSESLLGDYGFLGLAVRLKVEIEDGHRWVTKEGELTCLRDVRRVCNEWRSSIANHEVVMCLWGWSRALWAGGWKSEVEGNMWLPRNTKNRCLLMKLIKQFDCSCMENSEADEFDWDSETETWGETRETNRDTGNMENYCRSWPEPWHNQGRLQKSNKRKILFGDLLCSRHKTFDFIWKAKLFPHFLYLR